MLWLIWREQPEQKEREMANLINLREFDKSLRAANQKSDDLHKRWDKIRKDLEEYNREVAIRDIPYLDYIKHQRIRERQMVNMMIDLGNMVSNLAQQVEHLVGALTYLAHNNRDGRG